MPARCPAAVPASSGRQRLAGQRTPRPQLGGLVDAPPGLLGVDQRPLGDRVGQLAAQLLGGGQPGQLIDQRMLSRGQPAAHPLHPLQQDQTLTGGQVLEIQPEHTIDRDIQRVKRRGDRVSIHTPKLAEDTDKNCHPETTEAK